MRFLLVSLAAGLTAGGPRAQDPPRQANVVLLMSDDQGWADVGFHAHPTLETPNLDAMAAAGIRFERFYAAAPVCSPTRGSCLTGRHPYRYGVRGANVGHLPREERTLAEILQARGYRTGHFGKWHLGTLTKTREDSNRGGPRGAKHYAPPWEHGFDVCFSTEAKVPTFDPMLTPDATAGGVGRRKKGKPYGTAYWIGPGRRATQNLSGDDSRVIMDRAIPFIEDSVKAGRPFLAVIWFHAPHLPVVAGPRHLALYESATGRARPYFACLSALDEQVGRLRAKLRELRVAADTMLWFCSDNGPEGKKELAPGSAGRLRGRKRSLFEGGIRVPGLLEWPARVPQAKTIHAPCCTSDYLPTVLDALGIRGSSRPLDGISLLPLIDGETERRGEPIAFESGRQAALIGDRWKLVRQRGRTMLFDLIADPAEQRDLAAEHPERVAGMTRALDEWRASCERSRQGADHASDDPSKERPNILFIMADDLGPEWISCYGASGIETPAIDRLAADGMRFENAYSMPKCTPTRVTLLTGQYPFRHGWVNHWDVPRWGAGCHFDPAHNRTFARILRGAGYETAIAGKWQINDFRVQPDVLAAHGFDEWCVWTGFETGKPESAKRYWDPYVHTRRGSRTRAGEFGPDVFVDFLIDFMRRHRAQPMLLYYPMVLPHGPLVATPNEPAARGKLPRHKAMVRYVDRCVGRLVAALDELELRRKTYIFFTTDNGTSRGITGQLGGRPVQGGKGKLLESGCRAPFVVSGHRHVPRGVVTGALTDFTDILPTFAALAGVPLPAGAQVDGHSLARLIRGAVPDGTRRWILAMGGGVAKLAGGRVVPARPFAARVLRTKRWKLWYRSEGQHSFYDLARDPAESTDLLPVVARQGSEGAAAEAFRRLLEVASGLPESDAKPRYQPTPAQPWDRRR